MYDDETLELLKKLSADIKANTKIKQVHPYENTIFVKLTDLDSPIFNKMREFIQDDKTLITIKWWNKDGKLHFAKDIAHTLLKNDIEIERYEYILDKKMKGIDATGHYYDTSSFLLTSKWFNKFMFRHKEEWNIIDTLNKIIERIENSFRLFYGLLADEDLESCNDELRKINDEIAELRKKSEELYNKRCQFQDKYRKSLKLKIDMLKDF